MPIGTDMEVEARHILKSIADGLAPHVLPLAAAVCHLCANQSCDCGGAIPGIGRIFHPLTERTVQSCHLAFDLCPGIHSSNPKID
jgi:hypothetical protein